VDRSQLLSLLDEVRSGKGVSDEAASSSPRCRTPRSPQAVVIDHHRELRTGVPELVFGRDEDGRPDRGRAA
jgi:NCAIR mutase (PurE)-related protein